MSPRVAVKEGAIFLGDAHYSPSRPALENFLSALETGRLQPPQIFWMGDIFDLLVGGVKATAEENAKMVARINALDIESYYFEGNHDFNLKKVFPKMRVFPRKQQPVFAAIGNKTAALSHGDLYTPLGYELYIRTITNPLLLKVLNMCNFKGWITDKINAYNNSKDLCKSIKNFGTITDIRVENYLRSGVDCVVEGHFHQNEIAMKAAGRLRYVNLPAYACNQSYFIVELNNSELFVECRVELRSNDVQRR